MNLAMGWKLQVSVTTVNFIHVLLYMQQHVILEQSHSSVCAAPT